MQIKNKRALFDYAQISSGVILVALSFNLFFVPCGIAPGGFVGLATIVNYLISLPIGVVYVTLNLPLFLLSMKYEGRAAFIRSIFAALSLSALLDFMPVIPLTDDFLLAAVIGGAMMGIGSGLVIRGQATTGGTTMAAKLLSMLLKNAFGVGILIFALDFVIVALSGAVYGITQILYAMIAIYVSSKAVDAMQEGLTAAKMVFIISQNSQAISDAIINEMKRGATCINGKGAYSGAEKSILMCVITRFEVVRLKRLIKAHDENAFVIVNDSREIMGIGFSRI